MSEKKEIYVGAKYKAYFSLKEGDCFTLNDDDYITIEGSLNMKETVHWQDIYNALERYLIELEGTIYSGKTLVQLGGIEEWDLIEKKM